MSSIEYSFLDDNNVNNAHIANMSGVTIVQGSYLRMIMTFLKYFIYT